MDTPATRGVLTIMLIVLDDAGLPDMQPRLEAIET
jgi:hypothetical protein